MTYGVIILAVGIFLMFFFKENAQLSEDGLPVCNVDKLYDEPAICLTYELLFCDDLGKYQKMQESFPVLFAEHPSKEELINLAQNNNVESRIRILAYRRLKAMQIIPNKKEVFGVIVEYNQNINKGKGLDTLALYADGNIRYINHTGNMSAFTDGFTDDKLSQCAKNILEQAKQLAQNIGPWEKKRLPPPAKGNIRITLLVNGDIYFGQGTDKVMFNDNLGGPLLQNMSVLLQRIGQISIKQAPAGN